jgi:C-terminal processing protease CtpA/Prc
VNDCILEIDGVSMLGATLKSAHSVVLGAPGTSITFKVARRKGGVPLRFQNDAVRVLSPRTGVDLLLMNTFFAVRAQQLLRTIT